jgi:hypothetical protein
VNVENTMEFILEQLARVAVLQDKAAKQQAKITEEQAKITEQQGKSRSSSRERTSAWTGPYVWGHWKRAASAKSAVSWMTN